MAAIIPIMPRVISTSAIVKAGFWKGEKWEGLISEKWEVKREKAVSLINEEWTASGELFVSYLLCFFAKKFLGDLFSKR